MIIMEPAATTLPENTATTIPMEIVRGILSTYVGYTRDELLDRRVFIKCTRLTFALIGATPIFLMVMLYLVLHHGDVGGDERSVLGLIFASLWQFLGALSFYRCSLWKNSLIRDPRFQSDRIHRTHAPNQQRRIIFEYGNGRPSVVFLEVIVLGSNLDLCQRLYLCHGSDVPLFVFGLGR